MSEPHTMRSCAGCDHPLAADDLFCAHCGAATSPKKNATAPMDGRTAILPALVTAVPTDSAGESERDASPIAEPGSALGTLEGILRGDITDAGRLTLAAFERLYEGEVDDALLAAESAVTLNPRLWSAHLVAGVARNQRGETEQAEAHLQDAFQAEPMALQYKMALERMLASRMTRSRYTPPAWLTQLSPTAWGALVGVPLLLLGLMWVAASGTRRNNEFTRSKISYGGGGPTMAPAIPSNPAYPSPGPNNGPATPVTPPPAAPYIPAPVNPFGGATPQPSPAPPITYEPTPQPSPSGASVPSAVPANRGPGSLPQASGVPDMEPLPPASPNVNGAPELQHNGGTGAASPNGGRSPNLTPWNTPKRAAPNPAVGSLTIGGNGRARVGYEPAPNLNRSTLPPPAEAVTGLSRVAPSPKPRPSATPSPPAPVRTARAASAPSTATTPAPPRSNGRARQTEARRLQRQGRTEEAVAAYRDAISAYQDDLSAGRDPGGAERGIASSQAALDLLEGGR